MPRPVSLLPALAAAPALVVALVALLTGLAVTTGLAVPAHASAAPAARHQADTEPLAVTIDTLTPSTLPRRGTVQVTGSVTNVDTETWSSINLYPFVSASPLTSAADLAEAARTPTDAFVGERITDPGPYDTIDELAPGETRAYTVSISRSRLSEAGVSAEGVYWFGVHALGTSDEPRDLVADGRARTFLPLVADDTHTVDTALVVPVRHQVTHTADGRIAHVPSWTRALSAGGSLGSLVDLGVAAGGRPITWLVDPAVPDAVRELVAGNRPRSLAPTVEPAGPDGDSGESSTASPSGSPEGSGQPDEQPSESGSAGGTGSDDTGATSPAVAEAAATGARWLEQLRVGLAGSQVLSLPYGDVDVSGAAASDPGLYRAARARSGDRLEPWGVPTSPAVASPSGYLDAAGIRLAGRRATVLVTDRMFPGRAPTVAHVAGRTVGVTSWASTSGGPGPDPRRSTLAVRQRVLAEAAVRLLSRSRQPLLVPLSQSWRPESATTFFAGLDVPWLRLTSVSTALQRPGSDVAADRLLYPERQQRLILGADVFSTAERLVRAGETLQNLLTQNDEVGGTVQDEAFTDTSYATRFHGEHVLASAERSLRWIGRRLGAVRVDAPKAVILPTGSGHFAATITNTLDEPVTVKLRALTGAPLRIDVPADSIDLSPDSRTTLLLNASSPVGGVRTAALMLTDSDDVPLGSRDDLPIRANRVSNVIWLILGTGVGLLFLAIAVRLVRRVRSAGAS